MYLRVHMYVHKYTSVIPMFTFWVNVPWWHIIYSLSVLVMNLCFFCCVVVCHLSISLTHAIYRLCISFIETKSGEYRVNKSIPTFFFDHLLLTYCLSLFRYFFFQCLWSCAIVACVICQKALTMNEYQRLDGDLKCRVCSSIFLLSWILYWLKFFFSFCSLLFHSRIYIAGRYLGYAEMV